jgi:hypothetical protein
LNLGRKEHAKIADSSIIMVAKVGGLPTGFLVYPALSATQLGKRMAGWTQ